MNLFWKKKTKSKGPHNLLSLESKPFTMLMIARGEEVLINNKPSLELCDEFIANYSGKKEEVDFILDKACCCTFDLSFKAMGRAGINTVVASRHDITKNLMFSIAGSIVFIPFINVMLQDEQFPFESQKATALHVRNFFQFLPEDERVSFTLATIEIFKSLVKSGKKNVEEWIDTTQKIFETYIFQMHPDAHKLKHIDCVDFFSKQIRSILSAMT